MIRITRRISTEVKDGKAEVFVCPVASKSYPADIPTGIFVDPKFFRRGDIYVNSQDKYSRTLQQMEEGRAAKEELDWFCRRLYNIIRVTEDLETPITIDHIKKIYEKENELPKTGNWIKRETICRLLDIPLPARRIRYSSHRKLYDFLLDYVMKGRNKHHSVLSKMPLLREIYRFEMFQRIVRKKICYSLNVDTIAESDLQEMHQYFIKEHEYMSKYPEQMKKVIERTDEAFHRSLHPGIHKNKKELANAKMGMVKRIMTWLLEERETSNNPFEHFEIGKVLDPDTVVILEREELNQLCNHDYKGHNTRDRIRDIFIFMCNTGIRYQDLRYLKRESIRKERLTYEPRRKLYSIYPPITNVHLDKRTLELIRKHEGEDEEDRLFCCPRETQFDMLLKVVFKDCGLDRMVPIKDKSSGRLSFVQLYEIASCKIALHTFHNLAKRGIKTEDRTNAAVSNHAAAVQTEACMTLIEMLE